MNPLLSTALMGLFAFSGTTSDLANVAPTVQPLVTPTIASAISLETYTVSMTAYNAVPGQTDGDPYTTAAGVYSNPEVVAARSQDLADDLPFGTIIRVTGPDVTNASCGYDAVADQIGYRIIADTMNARMHDKIDILLNQNNTVQVANKTMNPSRALGMCQGVSIQVVGHVDISHMPKTQAELAQLVAGRMLAATVQTSDIAMR